ncbi:transcriptional regulator with XRE-family HTH domain [Agrobacterium larrymoorei]|uniref:Transcriptional regulator with XRE-family HTH domain n=1 Tax=Agrobacterium larrymoorei TaxID=160699 RepID=A0AAJ2BAR5_9HYPH|nr:helix-turn-helix transcriptional regulator [Agrobacterium larrymoorei]MDR6100473.1 transcriptional regulator with XRE-family HTH domain [Agrobacterium larrymoorei]
MKRRSSHSTADRNDDFEQGLRRPHPVDAHVGRKIRYWRNRHGITQGDLGAEIGVTFQQMQKYENGRNRVSSSRLYEIARCLRVPILEFFDGLPATHGGDGESLKPTSSIAFDSLRDVEHRRVIDAYLKLQPDVAKRLISLMQAIGSGQN